MVPKNKHRYSLRSNSTETAERYDSKQKKITRYFQNTEDFSGPSNPTSKKDRPNKSDREVIAIKFEDFVKSTNVKEVVRADIMRRCPSSINKIINKPKNIANKIKRVYENFCLNTDIRNKALMNAIKPNENCDLAFLKTFYEIRNLKNRQETDVYNDNVASDDSVLNVTQNENVLIKKKAAQIVDTDETDIERSEEEREKLCDVPKPKCKRLKRSKLRNEKYNPKVVDRDDLSTSASKRNAPNSNSDRKVNAVKFSNFLQNTNLTEVVLADITRRFPDSFKSFIRDDNKLDEELETVYINFCKKPELRNTPPLNAIKPNEDCDPNFLNTFHSILKIHNRQETKGDTRNTIQDDEVAKDCFNSTLSDKERDQNSMPEDVNISESILEKIGLPIVAKADIPLFEEKFPVTFRTFKRMSWHNELCELVFEDIATNMKELNTLKESKKWRETVLQSYFVQFYMNPDIRKKYRLKLKPCPSRARKNFLRTVDQMDETEGCDLNAAFVDLNSTFIVNRKPGDKSAGATPEKLPNLFSVEKHPKTSNSSAHISCNKKSITKSEIDYTQPTQLNENYFEEKANEGVYDIHFVGANLEVGQLDSAVVTESEVQDEITVNVLSNTHSPTPNLFFEYESPKVCSDGPAKKISIMHQSLQAQETQFFGDDSQVNKTDENSLNIVHPITKKIKKELLNSKIAMEPLVGSETCTIIYFTPTSSPQNLSPNSTGSPRNFRIPTNIPPNTSYNKISKTETQIVGKSPNVHKVPNQMDKPQKPTKLMRGIYSVKKHTYSNPETADDSPTSKINDPNPFNRNKTENDLRKIAPDNVTSDDTITLEATQTEYLPVPRNVALESPAISSNISASIGGYEDTSNSQISEHSEPDLLLLDIETLMPKSTLVIKQEKENIEPLNNLEFSMCSDSENFRVRTVNQSPIVIEDDVDNGGLTQQFLDIVFSNEN